MLSSAGGTRKGLGFLAGWVLSLFAVVAVTLLVTGGEPLQTGSLPSTASLVASILIGIGLLFVAWRQHRRRGIPRPTPKWMTGLDKLGVVSAAVLGFLLQPWGLVAAGAAAVTSADLSNPATLVTLAAYFVLASSSYVVMEVYAWRRPESARARLDGLRLWLDDHRDALVVVLALVVGLWLIAQSAYALATD